MPPDIMSVRVRRRRRSRLVLMKRSRHALENATSDSWHAGAVAQSDRLRGLGFFQGRGDGQVVAGRFDVHAPLMAGCARPPARRPRLRRDAAQRGEGRRGPLLAAWVVTRPRQRTGNGTPARGRYRGRACDQLGDTRPDPPRGRPVDRPTTERAQHLFERTWWRSSIAATASAGSEISSSSMLIWLSHSRMASPTERFVIHRRIAQGVGQLVPVAPIGRNALSETAGLSRHWPRPSCASRSTCARWASTASSGTFGSRSSSSSNACFAAACLDSSAAGPTYIHHASTVTELAQSKVNVTSSGGSSLMRYRMAFASPTRAGRSHVRQRRDLPGPADEREMMAR
jgi:hypothetical protein